MERVIERLWVLRHEPEGPLVPYLDAFATVLDAQGYKRRCIGPQIRLVANFSRWLHARQIAAESVTSEHGCAFLEEEVSQHSDPLGKRATLQRLMDFLDQQGVIHPLPRAGEATPIQQAVQVFATYLWQERALSDKTLIQYCPFIEHFLSLRFEKAPVTFEALRAGDVIAFIQQQAAQLSPARGKALTTALRSFLRSLRYRGEITLDLAAAVPTVPNWSITGIPRAIVPEHVRAVLAPCPRDTAVGRRDYAILLLLARLGLRSSEVVSLTLDSIDGEAGTISVAGKGHQAATRPLPVEVGEAIADYLHYGRPCCNSRALFLRARAPLRGLGAPQTVATIVGAAIQRAGIAPSPGNPPVPACAGHRYASARCCPDRNRQSIAPPSPQDDRDLRESRFRGTASA